MKTDAGTDQNCLVAGKSRSIKYDNPEKPLKYKFLRDYPDHYKQAESRHRAGLKQAEKPGMHVRTGEKQEKDFRENGSAH